MIRYLFILAVLAGSLPADELQLTALGSVIKKPSLSKVCFGSCSARLGETAPWKMVLEEKPDLYIFAGDNVYANPQNPAELRAKYKEFKQNPAIAELMKTVPHLAVFDDHDYGRGPDHKNDKMRQESARQCLDNFNVHPEDPRRQRDGIYGSYIFGDQGKRVQVILLDCRSFRDPQGEAVKTRNHGRAFTPYPENSPMSILGTAQWQWLDKVLQEKAQVRLLVSSFQMMAATPYGDKWKNYPGELKKLYSLIDKHRVSGLIVLSGDIHRGEMSRRHKGLKYPLYDFTSSGIAHGHAPLEAKWESPRSKFVNPSRFKNFFYPGGNYGAVEINWAGKATLIKLRLQGTNGKSAFEHKIPLSELQFSPSKKPEE